jgi:glycosyltransferase involved in cell wall biosynthesis
MRVLFITDRFSPKQNSGWSLRKHSLLEVFSRLGTVDIIVTLESKSVYSRSKQLVDFLQTKCDDVYVVVPSKRRQNLHVSRAYRLIQQQKPLMSSLQINREVQDFIASAIEKKPDIIFFDGVFVSQYFESIPHQLRNRCIVSPHNVESEIEWGIFTSSSGLSKLRSFFRYLDVMHIERSLIPEFPFIAAVSDRDAAFYRFLSPESKIFVLPNVVDVRNYPFCKDRVDNVILFVGSLNWTPNVHGLEWFVKNVFSKVHQKNPDVVLQILGRSSSALNGKLHNMSGIQLIGSVNDVRPYFERATLFVCPVFSGSGTRLKLIEAFAYGIPVVSTTKGCEGLEVEDNQHLFLAEDSHRFIQAINGILAEPSQTKQVTLRARKHAEARLSYEFLTTQLRELFNYFF